MRQLLSAVALAAAVSLLAVVPPAHAQYAGGMGGGYGSGMAGMDMSGMGGMMSMHHDQATGSDSGSQRLTCAIGQVMPFVVPQPGIDQLGRPFFYQAQGVYGPYDGFGYPVIIQTIGMQPGGTPFARLSRGYVPAPCPLGMMGGMSMGHGGMGHGGMGGMMMPAWGAGVSIPR